MTRSRERAQGRLLVLCFAEHQRIGPADRPNVKLPNDMKNVFEGWKTGDATKDAALADAERALGSVDDAIARGDTKSKALAFYYQDDALISEVKWIQAVA